MKDFFCPKKIYYHDTDCGGVVYYANYLKYLEEARTEYLSAKGIDLKELSNRGIWFVVSNLALNYKSPAQYQDALKIFVKISNVRNAAIEFKQEIKKGDIVLVEADTTLVCVGKDFKPMRMPDEIRQALP